MSPILLLEVDSIETKDGTVRRFQSQLFLGRDNADFIIEPNGQMKTIRHGGWVDFNNPYKIVSTKQEMKYQPL